MKQKKTRDLMEVSSQGWGGGGLELEISNKIFKTLNRVFIATGKTTLSNLLTS